MSCSIGNRRGVRQVLLAALCASLSLPASAAIDQITVTAEKREESAQDVPIAMSLFTGTDLDHQGIDGFADLKFRVPSLNFGSAVTGGESFIVMRGVGNENVTSGGDPGVAYHIDGVYLGRSTSVDKGFFDIERVEVLRGPQGTLYGRNSTGGTINVITRKPTNEFEAAGDILAGNYGQVRGRAVLSGPIVEDRLLARISAIASRHSGYQDNIAGEAVCGDCRGADAESFFVVRGHLEVRPSERVNILISGSIYNDNRPVATRMVEPFPPRFFGAEPNPEDLREVRKDFEEMLDLDSHFASITITADLGGAELTSISGYQDMDWLQTNDGDGSELSIAFTEFWRNKSEQFSQEIRLTSTDPDSPFEWLVGVFFYKEKTEQEFKFVDTAIFEFLNGGTVKTTSVAPFAQAGYDFGKRNDSFPVKLNAGLRWSYDKKKVDDFQMTPAFGVDLAKQETNSWDQLTGMVGVDVRPTDDLLIYVTASRGYRSGGFLIGNFPGDYDPEFIWSYEGGFKSQLFDNRLQFNFTFFYSDYKDIQVFVQEISASRIENAAKATVTGIEIDFVFNPVEPLTINGGFAWIDAKYDEFFSSDNRMFAGPLEDLSGNRLNRTPEFSIVLGAEYVVVTSIGSFTPRVDFNWQSDQFFRAINDPVLDRQKSFTKTDLRIIWTDVDERFQIEVFVKNIENSDVFSSLAVPALTLGQPLTQVTLNPPRTWGFRLGFSL